MAKHRTHTAAFILGVILLVFLDQYTKFLAKAHLERHTDLVLWKNVFVLRYIENRGAAFGMMQGGFLFFYLLTTVVLIGILLILRRTPATRRYLPLRFGLFLLFCGALGNLIDRVFRGYVVDFFYFQLIDFPVFNVADCYVTVSAVLLVLLAFFYYDESEYDYIFHWGKRKGDGH